VITYPTPSEAYRGVLTDLLGTTKDRPDDPAPSPRGLLTREILAYQFAVEQPVTGSIITASERRNQVIAAYLAAELRLYEKQTLDAEEFGAISKFWLKIANPPDREGRRTVNSNYGYLIFGRRDLGDDGVKFGVDDYEQFDSGWDWARYQLQLDRDTRQAIIHVSRPAHLWPGNLDQVCTCFLQFFIRGGKLELHWHMRSNDVVKGLVYDLPYACHLQALMREQLFDVTVGRIVWSAGSMHLYEKDVPVAREMVGIQEAGTEQAVLV
jgi:Thymidylate synthase